jgi:hypothetical protein
MATTMDSLFGPSPYEIQQQRRAQLDQAAQAYGQQDPFQRAAAGMYKAGGMLGGIGAQAMGMVDPAVANAQRTEQIMGQGDADLSSSAGMYAKAKQFMEGGDRVTATKLLLKANEMKKQEAAATLAQQKQDEGEQFRRDQMLESMGIKRQQLQQVADAAKMRSEDTRYTADQRREAAAEATAARLQLGQLMAAVRQMGIEAKSATKSDQPPKNLTREARLGWELENGKIDQATYDAAMSASPGGVLRQKQTEASNAAETGFSSVERNIEQLYDAKTGKLKPATQSLFGKVAQYRPEITMGQDSVDAKLALEALTDQVMMTNLADAKARVGQSFGSMQVQEWDKFTQQLTSLKRGLSEEKAADAMKYVSNFIKNKRAVLGTAMGTNNPIQADRTPPKAENWVRGTDGKLKRAP